jgi:hypothetical protein
MELLIFVAGVCILAALAMRFGYDSRETADSKEEEWANHGMRMELAA